MNRAIRTVVLLMECGAIGACSLRVLQNAVVAIDRESELAIIHLPSAAERSATDCSYRGKRATRITAPSMESGHHGCHLVNATRNVAVAREQRRDLAPTHHLNMAVNRAKESMLSRRIATLNHALSMETGENGRNTVTAMLLVVEVSENANESATLQLQRMVVNIAKDQRRK